MDNQFGTSTVLITATTIIFISPETVTFPSLISTNFQSSMSLSNNLMSLQLSTSQTTLPDTSSSDIASSNTAATIAAANEHINLHVILPAVLVPLFLFIAAGLITFYFHIRRRRLISQEYKDNGYSSRPTISVPIPLGPIQAQTHHLELIPEEKALRLPSAAFFYQQNAPATLLQPSPPPSPPNLHPPLPTTAPISQPSHPGASLFAPPPARKKQRIDIRRVGSPVLLSGADDIGRVSGFRSHEQPSAVMLQTGRRRSTEVHVRLGSPGAERFVRFR